MRRFVYLLAALSATCLSATQPTEVKAFFREGQTFITWKEDAGVTGEVYRVYRYSKPITKRNLAKAKLIAEVKEGSSRFEEMYASGGKDQLVKGRTPLAHIIPRLVIQPVGEDNRTQMLDKDTGLLVWTAQKERTSYYAVTTVAGMSENRKVGKGNSCGPVEEKKGPIGAVLYHVQEKPANDWGTRHAKSQIKKLQAEGKDIPEDLTKRANAKTYFDWYIMYMPYHEWNVDYIGYAVPFHLTRLNFERAKPGTAPTAHLDGIGTMNVFTATYANYGSGDFSQNALPTWYFGYGTKVKARQSGIDVKQDIRNFVQYRLMQIFRFARRKYNITIPSVHINGNSMGASGCIGLALAFPKFVTSIWANEGMTDYANPRHKDGKTMWTRSIWGNYGKPELGNKVKLLPFGDPQMDWYLKHDGMNVYDFRNVASFLKKNVDVSFPYFNIGHCHQDGSIPAHSQAYPFEKYIRDSRQTFCYCVTKGGHGWGQAWGNATNMSQHVTWDQSRPGFSGVPPIVGWKWNKHKDESSRTYMYKVAWGAKGRKIGGKLIPVVDTNTSWRMPLIHEARKGLEQDYFVDITPRNLQKLQVVAGKVFTYRILSLAGEPLTITDFSGYANRDEVRGKFKNTGRIKADKHNLLLIPNVPIHRSGCIVEVRAE